MGLGTSSLKTITRSVRNKAMPWMLPRTFDSDSKSFLPWSICLIHQQDQKNGLLKIDETDSAYTHSTSILASHNLAIFSSCYFQNCKEIWRLAKYKKKIQQINFNLSIILRFVSAPRRIQLHQSMIDRLKNELAGTTKLKPNPIDFESNYNYYWSILITNFYKWTLIQNIATNDT